MAGEAKVVGARENASIVHLGLKHQILHGELAPGEWLSQVKIATEFNVSRGPVREAIRLLDREGLLESRVNHRARVTPFSVGDLEQLYAIRILSEPFALGQATEVAGPQHLEHLQRLLAELDELAGEDIERWETVHRTFHVALVAPAGTRLVELAERSIDHSERYRRLFIAQTPRWRAIGAEDHAEIVAAVAAGDGGDARSLLARHLSRTALTLLMTAAPEHEPSLVRAALRQVSTDGVAGSGR